MNALSLPLETSGALIPVQVGLAAPDVQALRQAGRPVPGPVAALALIDTGAEMTCIDPQVLSPLIRAANLLPGRILFANLPAHGGMNVVSEYPVSLTLVHPSRRARANLVLRNHPVLEQPLGPLGYQALLGRDVLSKCLLVYNGPSSVFTLAY